MAIEVSFQFTDDQRVQYAAELLREPNAFQAALAVFGESEIGRCAYVAATWPEDPRILALQGRLLKDGGAKSFLPTKDEAVRSLWEMTKQKGIGVDDKVKCIKLMAEIQSWIQKDSIPVQVNVTSNVMVVKDKGDDDSWEKALKAQQEKLTKRDEPAAIRH